MKRKKLLAFIVGICLLAGSMPVMGEPETAVEEVPAAEEAPLAEEAPDVNQEEFGQGDVIQEEDRTSLQGQEEQAAEPYAEGRALVLMKEEDSGNMRSAAGGLSIEELYTPEGGEDSGELLGAGEEAQVSQVYLAQSDTMTTEELLESLKDDPRVEYAEPDYHIEAAALTNDPYGDFQWHLNQQDQVPGSIQAGTAWSHATGSSDYVVGVVDSGIDYNHPDLIENMWVSPEETYGYNGLKENGDPMDDTAVGHGTHVAGIIGARGNNGIGVSGVSQQVKLMALKAIDDAGGNVSSAIRCYEYARKQSQIGTKIVAMNNSWGYTAENYSYILGQVLDDFYEETGAINVFASGNSGLDKDAYSDAAYGGKKSTLNVDALNQTGELADFSDWGKQTTDLAAPGEDIWSTLPLRLAVAYIGKEAIEGNLLFREDYEDAADTFLLTPKEESDTAQMAEDPYNPGEQCLKWTYQGEESRTATIESQPVDMTAYQGEAGYFSMNAAAYVPLIDKKYTALTIGMEIKNRDGSWQAAGNSNAQLSSWGTISIPIEEPERIDWEHFTFRVSRIIKATDAGQAVEVYLDNIGFVKTAQPYAPLSGTSMAAPVVTGSLALLKSIFPEEDMGKIRARTAGGVTRTEALKGCCISGGYLNLEKAIQNPYPVLDTLTQEGDTASVEGYFFGSSPGTLAVEGQQLEILDWQENKITFRVPQTMGKGDWEFSVTRPQGAQEYGSRTFSVEPANRYFDTLPVPQPGQEEETGWSDITLGSSLVPWQNQLYLSTGEQYWEDGEGGEYEILWRYDITSQKWDMLKTGVPHAEIWNLTAEEGKIYFLNGLENGCFSWDIKTGAVKEIPFTGAEAKGMSNMSATVSDGESLWLIGGQEYSEETGFGDIIASVWKVDKRTGAAKKMPDLSYPRSGCAAACIDGKIVVTGGETPLGKFEGHTEIWDGTKWRQGASYPSVQESQGTRIAGAAVKGGMLTVGPAAEKGGSNQTVLYHMDTDIWEVLDIAPRAGKVQLSGGTAYHDHFYLFGRKGGSSGGYTFLTTKAETPAPQGPDTPENLKASPGDGLVTLSWKKVPGATGYVVYGYTGKEKSFNTRKAVWGRSITSWTEKKLQPGTQRRYVVRAFKNIDGVNYYSGCSKTAATAVWPKTAVIKSAAAGKGTARITLAGRPAGAVGYAYCTSMDNKTFRIVAKGPKMPYTMKGLKKGTNYIKVRPYAKDINGKTVYGPWTGTVKVKVK